MNNIFWKFVIAVCVSLILLLVPVVVGQIGNYPSLFNGEDGSFNGKIVVGEGAAASDLVVAQNIAADLFEGATFGDLPDLGKSVKQIETSTNKLNFLEPLGRVIPTLTEDDLDLLAGGEFTDRADRIPYTQSLQLRDTTASLNKSEYIIGLVVLDKNRDKDVNMYLLIPNGILIFEYILEFSKGIKSDIENNSLVDFEGEVVNLLGGPTFIYRSSIDTSSSSITLDFANVFVDDILEAGDTQTYDVGGIEYIVEVGDIYGEGVDARVDFIINGERIGSMKENERKKFGNGLNVIVKDLLLTGKNTINDEVDFTISSESIITLTDSDYTDGTFEEKVFIDNDFVEGGEVLIRGYEDTDGFVLQEIRYRLRAESKAGGDVYVPLLGLMSEYLEDPKGVFGFDFLFLGPEEGATSNINFSSIGKDAYSLSFTTNENLRYTIPLADNSDTSGKGFKYGNDENNLWFNEGKVGVLPALYNFTIERKDYFILTNAPIEETSDTHVLRYESISTGRQSVTFTDLVGGEIVVNYHNSSKTGVEGEGTIKFSSGEYTFYISNESDRNIAVDLNTDGDVNEDEVQIVTKYGGILDLGSDNFPDDSGGLDSFNVSLTTLSSMFDGDGLLNLGVDEVSIFTVSESNNSDYDINLDVTQMSTVPGDMLEVEALEIKMGGQIHGSLFILTDMGKRAEDLLIEYPESQVWVKTWIGSDVVLNFVRQGILDTLQLMAVPAEPVAPIMDNAVGENDTDIILIGGPCVNSVVRELLDVSMENCADGFEPGKSVIRYIEDLGRRIILIAGYSAEDTARAGKAFLELKGLDVGSEIVLR